MTKIFYHHLKSIKYINRVFILYSMISVIGAGPAGSFYASLAAKKDDVYLFEEHKVVGRPVACTGILTDNVSDVIKIPKDLILNKIRRFKIVSPNGIFIYIDLNTYSRKRSMLE